jgi:hypothetical protein
MGGLKDKEGQIQNGGSQGRRQNTDSGGLALLPENLQTAAGL